MRTVIVFMVAVPSASTGKGRHVSLEGFMLMVSGHKLVFTLTAIVSAGAGQEGLVHSGCQACCW